VGAQARKCATAAVLRDRGKHRDHDAAASAGGRDGDRADRCLEILEQAFGAGRNSVPAKVSATERVLRSNNARLTSLLQMPDVQAHSAATNAAVAAAGEISSRATATKMRSWCKPTFIKLSITYLIIVFY